MDLPLSCSDSLFGKMQRADNRLASFNSCPNRYFKPDQMAKAGFFYSGFLDRVQCPYCKGILGNWEPGDVPLEEHKRNFPYCPFLLECDDIRNPDYDFNSLLNPNDSSFSQILSYSLDNETLNPVSNLSLVKEPPESLKLSQVKNSFFTSYDSRFETFACWPHNNSLTPSKMAEAGFYYLGYEDYVKCFYCDGGLRNWSTTDDPWSEHAKWFPKCPFLEIVKGDKFIRENAISSTSKLFDDINKLTQNHKTQDQAGDYAMNESTTSSSNSEIFYLSSDTENIEPQNSSLPDLKGYETANSQQLNEISFVTNSQDAKSSLQTKIDEEMDKAMVKAILSIGVPRDTIFNTIYTYFKSGITFESSEALLKAISIKQQCQAISPITDSKTLNSDNTSSSNALSVQTTENYHLSPHSSQNSSVSSDSIEIVLGNTPKSNKLQRLESENKILKEQRHCKICLESEVEVVFINCGHFASCSKCALMLNKCPICREDIRGTVRIYLS